MEAMRGRVRAQSRAAMRSRVYMAVTWRATSSRIKKSTSCPFGSSSDTSAADSSHQELCVIQQPQHIISTQVIVRHTSGSQLPATAVWRLCRNAPVKSMETSLHNAAFPCTWCNCLLSAALTCQMKQCHDAMSSKMRR